MSRFAIDVTAAWRPQRVGMLTVATELSRALIEHGSADEFVLLCSRERPAQLRDLDCDAVLSPYRHEVVLKSTWLPTIEPRLEADAILYPYWPTPPRRRRGAPPAAIFVHDLEHKVQVIPEGLPHAAKPGPLPEGIEPGFILAVGTVEPRKNYPRLLIAYRRLRGRPGVPQLVVAGRAGWAYGDTLRRIAAEPGVRYLGHVDEPTLAALYEHASVLAFPSLYEGFGLPLLEAMSRGVPAVVGTAGALPELGMGAAISVDAESSDAIAGALERLLVDEGLRKEVGQEGIRRARDYTWASAAERVLAAMHRISRKSEKSAA